MTDKQTPNAIAQWLRSWWFLIAAGVTIIGTLVSMWFQLQYVIAAVNPPALQEYTKQQAILNTKREIRWCLSKLAWSAELKRATMLSCAD